VVLLGALDFATENFSLELPILGSVSLSFGVAFAAILYSGPVGAAFVVVMGSWNIKDLRESKPLVAMVFNAAQLALSAILAGAAFVLIGGVPLGAEEYVAVPGLLPSLAAAITFFAINVVLVSLYISLDRNMPILDVLRQQRFLSYTTSMVVLALLGLVLAESLDVAGAIAIVLVVAPFVVARQTLRAYEQLKAAYTDTVRCLVSTIEAKDKYTRGHSERVARYSRSICEALGLSGHVMEQVEIAALLHDVGKIDVSISTLQKDGPLTTAEYEEIKRHPASGANILQGIDLLSEIVPIVRAHHERVDGTGYPDGLKSDEIPFAARILAVADCFDAMTSDRPYRRALSDSRARAELDASIGTQLDGLMVKAFLQQTDMAE